MEELPPIWRVASYILNKQSRAADKGRSSSLGGGEVLTPPHRKIVMLRKFHNFLGLFFKKRFVFIADGWLQYLHDLGNVKTVPVTS